jgi:hypothetical protein
VEENELNVVESVKVPQAKIWLSSNQFDAGTNISDTAGNAAVSLELQKGGFDWTFTSDYCFSIKEIGTERSEIIRAGGKEPHFGKENCNGYSRPWSLFREEQSGIDYGMLKNKTMPILFYDEYILYQVI